MTRRDEVLSLVVPCDNDAPRVVRAALRRFESLGWVLGDIVLVASEIVTTAVRESGCIRDQVLMVRASLSRDRMTISVRDPGPSGGDAQPPPVVDIGANGWGRRIVEELAIRWGTERDHGYHVWAEVAVNM
jgi:anti-sigma regulatory factor (Ser/Thr protein kinase)